MFRHKSQQGFTVIELTLAMTFVAFILIFTTLTTIQMMKTYNKGVTIKEINQAGRTLTEDLSRSLTAGKASSVNLSYLDQGKLCVGASTYIWNPVYTGAAHAYNDGGVTYHKWPNGDRVGLARSVSALCNASNAITLPAPDENTFSLLSDQARVLDVSATRYDGGKLVKLVFTLGTFDTNEEPSLGASPIDTSGLYNTPYFNGANLTCRPNDQGNFCAFGTFRTTVYIGN